MGRRSTECGRGPVVGNAVALGGARRGQSLVEMAVLLPMITLLMIVTLDLGRAFFYSVRLADAVREGALYAAYTPHPEARVQQQAYAEANGQLGQAGGQLKIGVRCYAQSPRAQKPCGSPTLRVGDTVEVVGTYDFKPITGRLIPLWGETVTLRRSAEMAIQ